MKKNKEKTKTKHDPCIYFVNLVVVTMNEKGKSLSSIKTARSEKYAPKRHAKLSFKYFCVYSYTLQKSWCKLVGALGTNQKGMRIPVYQPL